MKQIVHMAANRMFTPAGIGCSEVILTLSESDYQRDKKGEMVKVENLSTVRFITDDIQIKELITWLIDVSGVGKKKTEVPG